MTSSNRADNPEVSAVTGEELAQRQAAERDAALRAAEEAGAGKGEIAAAQRAASAKKAPKMTAQDVVRYLVDAAPKELAEAVAERMIARKLSADEGRALLAKEVLKKKGWTVQEVAARLAEETEDGDETVETFVFDPETDDYVPATLKRSELAEMNQPQGDVLDLLALSPAYKGGDFARFDYFWGAPQDDRQMRLARESGWVPVKNAADKADPIVDGLVTRGDLCLMRRPKDLAPRYAAEAKRRAEGVMGKEANDFAELGKELGLEVDLGGEDGSGFSITEGPLEGGPLGSGKERPAPGGKKTFSFSKNPLHEKKVEKAVAALRGM